MFGLSWEQLILILMAALFLLGPERIPGAVKWVLDSLRKLRTMAAGAQDQFRNEMGVELEDLRSQIRELQSLKELDELRQLRALNPRKIVGDTLLGEEFSGGVTGFLGLDKNAANPNPANTAQPNIAASPAVDSAAAQPWIPPHPQTTPESMTGELGGSPQPSIYFDDEGT